MNRTTSQGLASSLKSSADCLSEVLPSSQDREKATLLGLEQALRAVGEVLPRQHQEAINSLVAQSQNVRKGSR